MGGLIVLLLFLSFIPLSAKSIDVEPKRISMTVSNVPPSTPSLFIPINISSKSVDLYRVELKDVFLNNYAASIERDDEQHVVGISFASLSSRSLPERLEADLKLKFNNKEKLAENKDKNNKSNHKKNVYPLEVSISWDNPWVYTKATKQLKQAFVGFSSLTVSNDDADDVLKEHKKRKRSEEENKDSEFYVRSLGQTLVRSGRTAKKQKQQDFKHPHLQLIRLFVITPLDQPTDRLYIPILIEDAASANLELDSASMLEGAIFRLVGNNLIEVSSASGDKPLPAGKVLSANLSLKQSSSKLSNKITLGSPVSQPAQTISGVHVLIEPKSVVVNNSSILNLLDF